MKKTFSKTTGENAKPGRGSGTQKDGFPKRSGSGVNTTRGHKAGQPSPHTRPFKPATALVSSRQDEGQTGDRHISRSYEHDEEALLLPGIKPVLELLENSPERVDAVFLRKGRHGKELEHIADLCRIAGVRFSLLEASLFSRLYPMKSQGVVARLFSAGYCEFDTLLDTIMDSPLPLLLALDQVQDPGNAGTLARTLYAMGGAGLIVPRHNGVYLGAAAAKSSAGALEQLPVSKVANLGQALDAAKKRGLIIYGAAASIGPSVLEGTGQTSRATALHPETMDVFTFIPRTPAILVLGSEEDGMRQGILKRCDILLSIPMLREFDSLNVAQAGGIIISCFARHFFELGKNSKTPS